MPLVNDLAVVILIHALLCCSSGQETAKHSGPDWCDQSLLSQLSKNESYEECRTVLLNAKESMISANHCIAENYADKVALVCNFLRGVIQAKNLTMTPSTKSLVTTSDENLVNGEMQEKEQEKEHEIEQEEEQEKEHGLEHQKAKSDVEQSKDEKTDTDNSAVRFDSGSLVLASILVLAALCRAMRAGQY